MTCPGREVPGRNIHTRTQPTLTDQAREGRDHGGGSTNTPLSPLSFVLTSLGLCSCASALCLALGPKWCPPRAVARATWTPSPPNVQVRHLRVLAGLYPDRPPALRFWAAGSKEDRRTLPQVSKSRAHPPPPPGQDPGLSAPALVSWGCCHKAPEPGGLRQQRCSSPPALAAGRSKPRRRQGGCLLRTEKRSLPCLSSSFSKLNLNLSFEFPAFSLCTAVSKLPLFMRTQSCQMRGPPDTTVTSS